LPNASSRRYQIEPMIPHVSGRAIQFLNVCYDPDKFCGLDFPASPCESVDGNFLLTESCQASRTLKFDLWAPIAPTECVRFKTAPSPANIYLRRHGVKSIRSIAVVMYAILAVGGMIGFPFFVHAQASAGGEFKLSQSVHWGSAVLPTGEYTYSVESAGWPNIVRVSQVGGNFTGVFLPRTISQDGDSGSKGIVLARVGEEMFVSSLRVEERGLVLNFSPPSADTAVARPDATRTQYISITKDPALGYFTIFNPGGEKISYSEAEKVYLAACETIEKEFNRTTPIRPRLTVHLHSNENNLHYPDRDLRLSRWDKNRFAEAVVELVLHDMISAEDRNRLTKQAVAQAGATVSLCELKNCTN
jgi:hypothetical protein